MDCPFEYKCKTAKDQKRFGHAVEIANRMVAEWWRREAEKQVIAELMRLCRPVDIDPDTTVKVAWEPTVKLNLKPVPWETKES